MHFDRLGDGPKSSPTRFAGPMFGGPLHGQSLDSEVPAYCVAEWDMPPLRMDQPADPANTQFSRHVYLYDRLPVPGGGEIGFWRYEEVSKDELLGAMVLAQETKVGLDRILDIKTVDNRNRVT